MVSFLSEFGASQNKSHGANYLTLPLSLYQVIQKYADNLDNI